MLSDKVQQLQSLLSVVSGADTSKIAEATKILKEQYLSQPTCITWLVQILQSVNADAAIRQLAAVEARKVCINKWEELQPNMRTQIKSTLLEIIKSEQTQNVKHSIARIVAEIAIKDLPQDDWEELPVFLYSMAKSNNAIDREIGLYVIFCLCESLDFYFEGKIEQFFELFSTTIQDQESHKVAVYTVLATGQLSQLIERTDKHAIAMFQKLLPYMVNVLNKSVSSKDEDSAKQIFEVFGDFFFTEPSLISKSFADLLQLMTHYAESKDTDDEYRNMALSWLTLAVRYKAKRIKSLKAAQRLVILLLNIGAEDDTTDIEEDCPSRLAIRLIDVMSSTMPPAQVFEPLLSALPHYMSNSNSGFRKAVLLAIGVAIEGATDYASNKIELIVPEVTKGLQDPEFSVKKAALMALTQLAEELPEDTADRHATFIPLVYSILNGDNTDLRTSACACLDVLIEILRKEDVQTYLKTLLKKFIEMINDSGSPTKLRAYAISSIGSLLHAGEDEFDKYFDVTVCALAPFLSKPAADESEDEAELREAAIDTISVAFGSAARKKSEPYFNDILPKVLEGMSMERSKLRESCLCFFAICSRVYKEEFGKYLNFIVPELFSIINQNDFDEENFDDATADNLEYKGAMEVGDASDSDDSNAFKISTAISTEKEIAAESLGELCSYCKSAFLPYLEDSVQMLIKLTDNYNDSVRKAAISSLWRFVATLYYIKNEDSWTPSKANEIRLDDNTLKLAAEVRKCIAAMDAEESEMSQAETIKICGPQILGTQEDVKALCDRLSTVLKKKHECQMQSLAFSDNEDEEELKATEDDLEGDSAEAESRLIDSACDVIVALSYVLGQSFKPLFEMFFPLVMKYCTSESATERSMCIATLAESVNGLKSESSPYVSQLFEIFMKGLDDSDVEVRSNSAYAVGILCEASGIDLAAHYMTILQKLSILFESKNAKNEIDNAIGCVARMIMVNERNVPLSQVIPEVVRRLPLKKDYHENESVFRMIFKLYEQGNADVIALTDKLIPVFNSVLSPPEEQLKAETRNHLTAFVKSLRPQFAQLIDQYETLKLL